MKITILAPGSRGDVQPYVALGVGLQQTGHSVGVIAGHDFQTLITSYGLEFHDLGASMQAIAQSMQGLLEQGNFLKILSSMGKTAQQLAVQAAECGLDACQGSDLIVAGLGGLFTGQALSEKLGIPLIQAHYFPFTPTREFPNPMAPLPPVHLPGWGNRLSHRLVQQMLWQSIRAADNKARREVLEIAPAPFFGPFSSMQGQNQLVLYGYSPQVLPPPKDWGAAIHVTGYWFLEPTPGWQPPAELVNFIEAGPPPVYIGFGSMPNNNPEETTRLVLHALASAGRRGVISTGWGGMKKGDLPESAIIIDSVPFSWLFPQMAAIVHHGGAGTTSIGLWAGVPAVVTPFMGDQPFWGRRIYELGVGPKPIPRRRLTADNLAEAIHIAGSDKTMQQRAARLGEQIRAEDGIPAAVAAIELRQHPAGPQSRPADDP